MKPKDLLYCTLVCCLALVTTQCATRPVPAASASPDIPHLRKQGTATQLIVDGKPFLVMAAELTNNSATSVEYMKAIWPKLVRGKSQYHPGGRFLEPGRTTGREVRFQRARRRHPGRAEPQPACRAVVVRKLEERPVELSARLGKTGLRAIPARPDRRRQEHRTAQHPQRCQPGCRCPRLCGPDAAYQGGGWPRAHGHHDPGGERSGNEAGTPATARRWRMRRLPGPCRRN